MSYGSGRQFILALACLFVWLKVLHELRFPFDGKILKGTYWVLQWKILNCEYLDWVVLFRNSLLTCNYRTEHCENLPEVWRRRIVGNFNTPGRVQYFLFLRVRKNLVNFWILGSHISHHSWVKHYLHFLSVFRGELGQYNSKVPFFKIWLDFSDFVEEGKEDILSQDSK